MKQAYRCKRYLWLVLTFSLMSQAVFSQTLPPIPPRPINLPDLSADGAGYLSLADQTRIRFQILADFADNIAANGDMALVSDPVLQAAAQRFTADILARLAPDNDTVPFLLANPEFGASAFVGGVVITQQGLWAQSPNLSAFAAVLAHEWVHIHNQHISRMMAAMAPSQWMGLLAGLAGLAAAGHNAQLGQALIFSSAALPTRQSLAFSRDMEEEADREGINILARAGFSPQGMVGSMEVLTRYRGVGGDTLPFLQTHPLSEERLAAARRRANQYLGDNPINIPPSQTFNPQRPIAELQSEFDWLRYLITDPSRRVTQRTLLKLHYGEREWFAPFMALMSESDTTRTQEDNAALRQTLLDALAADHSLTPTLITVFSQPFNAKTTTPLNAESNWQNRYWQLATTRFPDSSLIGQLAAGLAWQQMEPKSSAPARALAQHSIERYLAHPAWETPLDQPSAWNDLLVSWFQTTEQPLGESFYLARSSLIRGNWELVEQNIARCEKHLTSQQPDVKNQALIQAMPGITDRIQSMKSLLRLLQNGKGKAG